jgi:hypothetical protein
VHQMKEYNIVLLAVVSQAQVFKIPSSLAVEVRDHAPSTDWTRCPCRPAGSPCAMSS